jgi:putative Ca2+/H+ antiporter (TMEM165/GDT1 family)
MDWKVLLLSFGTIFLAELGDKTQLAVLSFATSSKSPGLVFAGAAAALVVSTLLAVLVGAGIKKIVPAQFTHIIAGAIFVVIGVILIIKNIKL